MLPGNCLDTGAFTKLQVKLLKEEKAKQGSLGKLVGMHHLLVLADLAGLHVCCLLTTVLASS